MTKLSSKADVQRKTSKEVDITSKKSLREAGVIVSDTAIALANPGVVIFDNAKKVRGWLDELKTSKK